MLILKNREGNKEMRKLTKIAILVLDDSGIFDVDKKDEPVQAEAKEQVKFELSIWKEKLLKEI